jgi:ubiquitin carboxyl-terminal hydrolase 12/46
MIEMFEGDYHQDTHEFLIWLLNDINDLLIKRIKASRLNALLFSEHKDAKPEDLPKTWLQQIFEGTQITLTKCLNCKKVRIHAQDVGI